MIHFQHGEYVVDCDVCEDNTLDGYETFQDAVDGAREEGWRTRKSAKGQWENVCPNCH